MSTSRGRGRSRAAADPPGRHAAHIDIGPGAVAGLAPLLADRRISSGGHVAVVVGPGLGEEIATTLRPSLENGEIWDVAGGSVQAGADLAARLRAGFYDAVVGIGGGRTLDVAKYAASLSGLPLVAVATSLAHDGIASPVASLEDDAAGHKCSFGVQIRSRSSSTWTTCGRAGRRCGGRGSATRSATSRRSRTGSWPTRARRAVDGVAVTFARMAASRSSTARTDRRRRLPDGAGRGAGAVRAGDGAAGSSRPCSGSDHEILPRDRPPVPRHRPPRRAGGRGALFSFVPARRPTAARLDGRPACAGTGSAHAARPRADGGAVRPGRARPAGHPARPLHDPRAPGAGRGGRAARGRGRLR